MPRLVQLLPFVLLGVGCVPDVVPTDDALPFPKDCLDRKTSGDESDVDCGGSRCGRCFAGAHCAVADDCDSKSCTSGSCVTTVTGVWREPLPKTSLAPPARSEHAMAYFVDPAPATAQAATFMFGGSAGDTRLWSWDGEQWRILSDFNAGPLPRAGTVMAFVPPATLVVHGGFATYTLSDTWHFNGIAWKEATPAQNPGGRAFGGAVYDPAAQRVRLLGGYEQATETDSPKLVEGEWYWDDGPDQWSTVSSKAPPARSSGGLVYAGFTPVLFGGTQGSRVGQDDLWTVGPLGWQQASPLVSPPKRFGAMLSFAARRGRVVLFGGADGTTLYNDTWELDVKTLAWAQIQTPEAPPAREHAAVAFDAKRNRVVLFGGSDGAADRADLWEYHALGNLCTSDEDCDTSACVDGVCCATPSCGSCQACNAPGSIGTCAPVPVGRTDPDSCPGYCKADSGCVQ